MTRGQAWSLTLVCVDMSGKLNDPEELYRELTLYGTRSRYANIRCALTSRVSPVETDEELYTAGVFSTREWDDMQKGDE